MVEEWPDIFPNLAKAINLQMHEVHETSRSVSTKEVTSGSSTY
jgi:hypothetical protein